MPGKVSSEMDDRVWGSTLGAVYSQQPRSTQPGHPSMGRCNQYQPEGGDALQLGSIGRYDS